MIAANVFFTLAHWIVFEAEEHVIDPDWAKAYGWPCRRPRQGGRLALLEVQNWISARAHGARFLQAPYDRVEAAPISVFEHPFIQRLDKAMCARVRLELRKLRRKSRPRKR